MSERFEFEPVPAENAPEEVAMSSQAEKGNPEQERAEQSMIKLTELAERCGYVAIPTAEGLELRPEDIAKLRYTGQEDLANPNTRYFMHTEGKYGTTKIIAKPVRPMHPGEPDMFAADIFNYARHSANHDFTLNEMRQSMEQVSGRE